MHLHHQGEGDDDHVDDDDDDQLIILIMGWECIVKLELGKEEELDDGQCPSYYYDNDDPPHQGRMMKKGSMMVSYQPLGRIPNFFRSIISNQVTNKTINNITNYNNNTIIIINNDTRLKLRRTLTSCWKRSTLLVATCNGKV